MQVQHNYGKDKTGLGFIEFRTEVRPEEQHRMSMRPGPGQHLEYYDHETDKNKWGIRLVNDTAAAPAADKPANPQARPVEPARYAEMDDADLRVMIAERGLPEPKRGARLADLIRLLQDADAAHVAGGVK